MMCPFYDKNENQRAKKATVCLESRTPDQFLSFTHRSQLHFLQPALIVGASGMLLVVVIDPVVKSAHRSVAQLREEDVLERGAANLAASARIQTEPDRLQQIAMRLRIERDLLLALQKGHGVPHQRPGQQGVHEGGLLVALHGRDVFVDAGVLFVVVVELAHGGHGRIGVQADLVDGDETGVRKMYVIQVSQMSYISYIMSG